MHAPPLWTGRIEFDLTNGKTVATMEVSVRIDAAVLWIGNRTVAVVDRDVLRRWAHHPDRNLTAGDVEFTLLGNQLAIGIDSGTPYPLPTDVVHHLVALI